MISCFYVKSLFILFRFFGYSSHSLARKAAAHIPQEYALHTPTQSRHRGRNGGRVHQHSPHRQKPTEPPTAPTGAAHMKTPPTLHGRTAAGEKKSRPRRAALPVSFVHFHNIPHQHQREKNYNQYYHAVTSIYMTVKRL